MENGEEALGAERTVVVTYEKLKSFGKMILFTNNHENTKNFIYGLFHMVIYGNY
ncbi:hypothetical protein C5S29_07660 [ANME-1 cluster archaeon GoMg3.2]|jgi:hypothetical protein|nr:hypothetical protein [ANME-1 cluster archaeon GoMg3.2]